MGKKIKCWVCGAEHDYCPTCGQTHGWKYVACTPEHYQVYLIIEDFRLGVINKEEAIARFEKYGVTIDSDLSWIMPNTRKYVQGILEKEVKAIKTTKKSKLFE